MSTTTLAKKLKDWGIVSSSHRGVMMIRIVLAAILDEVADGKVVHLRRFGTFVPRTRNGRTIHAGDRVLHADDRTIMTFRSSVAVKRHLNGEEPNPMLLDLGAEEM